MDAPATQAATSPPRFEHVPATTYSAIHYETAGYASSVGAAALSDSLWLRPGFELCGGGRFVWGSALENGHAFEGFVSFALAPHFAFAFDDERRRSASWEPSLGIEVGLSTVQLVRAARPAAAPNFPLEPVFVADEHSFGLLYGQIVARAFHFRINKIDASAFGISVGTHFAHPGAAQRFQLELLTLGIAL